MRFVWSKSIIFAAAAAALGLNSAAAAAEVASDSPLRFQDPKPADDGLDAELPLPGGLKMIFRVVRVPGADVRACDEGRFVRLGDPTGKNVYEATVRFPSEIGGSFPHPDGGAWALFFGKYEVTKGQYAAIAACDDAADGRLDCAGLDVGLDRYAALTNEPEDARLSTLTGAERMRALAKPVTGLTWTEMQAFVDRYNRWCWQDAACASALRALDPNLVKGAAFVRLPTEAEWEYVVRGGGLPTADTTSPLPFAPKEDWEKYAILSKVGDEVAESTNPVGSRDPTLNGVFDAFGNVQEVVSDSFHLRLGGGKAGALTVRGGTYRDEVDAVLRASYRSEAPIYRFDEINDRVAPNRSFTTGLRLSVGSSSVANQANLLGVRAARDEMVNALPGYLSCLSGRGEAMDPTLAGSDQLSEIRMDEIRAADGSEHMETHMERPSGADRTAPGSVDAGDAASRAPTRISGPRADNPLDRIEQIAMSYLEDPELNDDASIILAAINETRETLTLQTQENAARAARLSMTAAETYANQQRSRERLIGSIAEQRQLAERFPERQVFYETRASEFEAQIENYDAALNRLMSAYAEYVGWLGRTGSAAEKAIQERIAPEPDDRKGAAIKAMLLKHAAECRVGRCDAESWRREFDETFADASLWDR